MQSTGSQCTHCVRTHSVRTLSVLSVLSVGERGKVVFYCISEVYLIFRFFILQFISEHPDWLQTHSCPCSSAADFTNMPGGATPTLHHVSS